MRQRERCALQAVEVGGQFVDCSLARGARDVPADRERGVQLDEAAPLPGWQLQALAA